MQNLLYVRTVISDNNFALDVEVNNEPKSLTEAVCSFVNSLDETLLNFEIFNEKTFKIATELANAIDKNSVVEVKKIKYLYNNSKEYINAVKFLDTKCKDVWNVLNKNLKSEQIPFQAMKVVGISIVPALDSILDNAVIFYENKSNKVISKQIKSILSNRFLNYTIEDILNYFQQAYEKEGYKCDLETVRFLASCTDFNYSKLQKIGVTRHKFNRILKVQPLKVKIKYYFNQLFHTYLHI